MLNRRPRGPLCWVMAFFTASYQHLLWTPIQSGAPSPIGLVWLSLRQSMRIPWEFSTSSHFISQFSPTLFPLITAIRMCHFLPVHHSEWHFWPGRRSKYHSCIHPPFVECYAIQVFSIASKLIPKELNQITMRKV